MKQFITSEMVLEELSENPHKYPTKDDWMTYMSNLAYCKFDDAMLTKIANGGSTNGIDEAQKKYHELMMDLAEKVWNISNSNA